MQRLQLGLATVAFAISFSVWGLVSALAPQFKQMYHLTPTQAAIMVALPIILGSLFRIPVGILADRFGGRAVLSALLVFNIVPAAGIALLHSYSAVLIFGFLLGLAGSSFAAGVSFSSKWFSAGEQGFALGIFGIGNIGQSVAVFGAPHLADALGWESVFWIFGLASVAWACVFYLGGKDAAPGSATSFAEILRVFVRERMSWALSFFYFITFGGFVALGVYLPLLLKTEFHLDLADAGLRTAGFVAVATLLRPLGGKLADVFGSARVLAVVFLGIAVLALLLTSSSFTLFTVGALGCAALLGIGNGAVFKLVPQLFPLQVGIVTGLVGALGGLGGFFPPIVLGILKQSVGSYAPGFVLLSVFSLAALLITVALFLRKNAPGATINRENSAA